MKNFPGFGLPENEINAIAGLYTMQSINAKFNTLFSDNLFQFELLIWA
jgi:hypothetical protein